MMTFINWFALHQDILGWNISGLIIGMVLLYFGGDWLVDSSSAIAKKLGVRPMIIGLTIVAFGTSCPELLVSTISGLQGQPSVALGNVVGSNFTNIALILGLAALLKPVLVEKESISLNPKKVSAYFVALICALLVAAFAWDGEVKRYEGLILVAGIIAFTAQQIGSARRHRQQQKKEITDLAGEEEDAAVSEEKENSGVFWVKNIGLLLISLVFLALGAKWLVDGGVGVARDIGISELVIGLTIVALGTSLPELAASVIGIIKGEDDIALGNIIGSNIFNVLGVLGISSVINPIAVEPTAVCRDIPVMIGITVLLYVLMRPGYIISRWRGGLLLACYIGYTVAIYLV